MPVILIDANMEGQGAVIWMRLQSAQWQDVTAALDLSMRTFGDVGLDRETRDDVVWRFCQAQGHYLLTSNRNEKSTDSLEATLRREGTPSALPVFSLPDPDRVYRSSAFLERVVVSILSYLLDADNIRGTGRLYLPMPLQQSSDEP